MLTQQGSGAPQLPAPALEQKRPTGQGHPPELGVLDARPEAAPEEVLVLEQVLHGEERSAQDLGPPRFRPDLALGARHAPLVEVRVPVGDHLRLHELLGIAEARIRKPVGPLHQIDHPVRTKASDGEVHVAVRTAVDASGQPACGLPRSLSAPTAELVGNRGRVAPVATPEVGLGERDVDVLSNSVAP